MGIVLENGFIDEMRNFLQQLWDADTHDYAYMWDDYEKIKEELVCRLAKDVNIAIAFLDAIDFNDEVDQHIITCIPTITSRLGRFGAQFLFISHLVSLQKKFPNVYFESAIRWAQLSCDFTSGKNSTDDGPPNKEVYFGGSL